MYIPWGTRRSHKMKHGTRKPKVRWEVLGLQDPAVTSLTPSIEDIRRQVISASNYELNPDTLARPQAKGASRKLGSKQ